MQKLISLLLALLLIGSDKTSLDQLINSKLTHC
jgi:hypothetical protein